MYRTLEDKRILITGSHGFLGHHVMEALKKQGVPKENLYAPTSKACDLRKWRNCAKAVKDKQIVIHLAGKIGGIAFNKAFPGELFYDNAMMGLQLIEEARKANVEKFVIIGTTCEYPDSPTVPFIEEDIWKGYPTKETAPYGLAKKMLMVQAQTYREQYGFNAISLLPTNLYGSHDNFSIEYSHVIPALIRRIHEAKQKGSDHIDIWGSGSATREFLYANDAAEGILMATEKYNKPEPVNLGTGKETSIKELVKTISEIIGFEGEIRWDATKPDGCPRRCLNVKKAYDEFGFRASTSLADGLKETIKWYLANEVKG